jgi:hypothetical protein
VRTSRSSSQDWLEGDSVNNGGYGGAAPTFSELQQAGRPRPPAATSTDRLVPYDLSPANQGKTVPTGPPADAMGGTTLPYGSSPAGPPVETPAPASDAGGGSVPTPNGESDFEKALRERYQSSPNAPQFVAGARAQTASQFVPGANPFTPSDVYKPGQFSGSSATSQVLSPAILKAVMDQLANPSGYTTDVAKSTFDRLGGAIDDQYNVDNQRIDEEMARRGIPVSTIAGGRLFDSNVARKSAKENLAGQILTDQAATIGSDRARAVASAMGLSDDDFNRILNEYQTNAAAGQQGFANQLTAGSFNEGLATDKFNNDLTAGKFNADEDQRGFSDALDSFNTNRASDSQGFNETEQKLKDYLGFGQQAFDNQTTTQQTNNQSQQQLLDMLMKLFGGTGGGTA